MEKYWYLYYIYEFVLTFLFLFIFYEVFVNKKRKTYKTGKKSTEIDFMIRRYNLDIQKIGYKKLLRTLTISNCLIMSLIVVVFTKIENFLLSLLVAFIMAVVLIYSVYEIIGRYYKRKGERKDV